MTIICQLGLRGSGMALTTTYIVFSNWKAFGANQIFDYNVNENYISSIDENLDKDIIDE